MPSIDHIMRWRATSAPLNTCPLVSNNYTSLTIFYYVDTIDLYYFTTTVLALISRTRYHTSTNLGRSYF